MNEIVISGLVALFIGIILKLIDLSVNKGNLEDAQMEAKIIQYQESLQKDIDRLTNENHILKAEADKYREAYHKELDKEGP